MQSGIYGIQNSIDAKWYIGMTIMLKHRMKGHLLRLRKKNHWNPHLQASFSKYGEENFRFYIIEEAPEEYLSDLEQYWINILQSNNRTFGYNIESGGRRYRRWGEETKKIMSERQKGIRPCDKCMQNSILSRTGKHHSFESKIKMSIARKGKPIHPKTKAALLKVAENRRGKPVSEKEANRLRSMCGKGAKWSQERRIKMKDHLANLASQKYIKRKHQSKLQQEFSYAITSLSAGVR